MDDMENKVVIREFNEDRDIEVVMKLEKNCNLGPNKGISIFTSMMDDPLCRIRFYPIHVMLVAEFVNNGELVGMVRGCIKCVGTGFGRHVKLGCILGLRVSPTHRRIGIGLKLVQSLEEWMIQNGAQYTFLATEEKNIASTNLFTLKCNYVKFSSLIIYVQPVNPPANQHQHHHPSHDHITVQKLAIDEAISFYKNHLAGKDIYPTDIEAILKEKLSLGTWICYFKEENHEDIIINSNCITQSCSWAIFSIWNTCGAYKLQLQTSSSSSSSFSSFSSFSIRVWQAVMRHARNKILPCISLKKWKYNEPLEEEPFGFLFLYGVDGGGERKGELMESVWRFAARLTENVEDCKAIVTELGFSDPLREYVPKGISSSMSCIEDLWYLKRVSGPNGDEDDLTVMRPVGNVFVDPRDF